VDRDPPAFGRKSSKNLFPLLGGNGASIKELRSRQNGLIFKEKFFAHERMAALLQAKTKDLPAGAGASAKKRTNEHACVDNDCKCHDSMIALVLSIQVDVKRNMPGAKIELYLRPKVWAQYRRDY
jgi:hypothetical protein